MKKWPNITYMLRLLMKICFDITGMLSDEDVVDITGMLTDEVMVTQDMVQHYR